MQKSPSLLHIWSMYLPTLFDRTHPYGLRMGADGSTLIAGRFVDNGAPLHPRSYYLTRETPSEASTPTLTERVLKRVNEPLYWFRLNRFAWQWYRRVAPEVVHIHFGNTAALLLPFLRKVSSTKIVTFYGNDASECLKVPLFRKKYRELFQVADSVLVLCEAAKNRLIEAGCPEQKTHLWNVPPGVEAYPHYKRTRVERTRFLICARFVEKKGYRFLVQAFENLLKKGKKVSLTMMGYGPLNPEFQVRFEREIKEGIVRIINTELRPDFETVYNSELQNHDIFVHPSTSASNGDDEAGPALTMIAAQASGLPVVCTPFPGSELSMQDGVTGVFCLADNTNDLSEKMAYLSDHPELWETMGQRACKKVKEDFSLESCMQRLYEVYTTGRSATTNRLFENMVGLSLSNPLSIK